MIRKLVGCVCMLVLMSASAIAVETGKISGRVLSSQDLKSQGQPCVVFICDAESGQPLVGKNYLKLSSSTESISGLSGLKHAQTDDKGLFEFNSVPAGSYRLVAQSWPGHSGIPDINLDVETVELHGRYDDIQITADRDASVEIRPLGSSSMTIINDPEEGNAFLVLSTQPMRGDPVLGFLAWGEKFAKNAIAVTHMMEHKVTFRGLPDETLYAGLFNFDNNPGVGGISFDVTEGGQAKLPIFATWSNGKYDPPERLLPLVEYLEGHDSFVRELLQQRFPNAKPGSLDYQNLILASGEEAQKVEGFGEVSLFDLLAAETYRKLRQSHKNRSR